MTSPNASAPGASAAQPLAGHSFVITRPAEQAGRISQMIEAAGGQCIHFPLLQISPLQDYRKFDAQLQDIAGDENSKIDGLIFVSANAVEQAFARLNTLGLSLNPQLPCYVVGPSTRAALQAQGMRNIAMPTNSFDSEGLLALPELQAVQHQHLMIVRGEGGRDLIASTLQQRGAHIHIAECYRRQALQHNTELLDRSWQQHAFSAVLLTSSEAMRYFLQLARGKAWLSACKIIVNHVRLTQQSQALIEQGTLDFVVAAATDDEAMFACLLQQFH
jgi:uroporphyrinogen-III synthase